MILCSIKMARSKVSLFTREWIEIEIEAAARAYDVVSLFTREWIEMQNRYCRYDDGQGSPSLRGSGLKFFINKSASEQSGSPSLRGSGLKCKTSDIQVQTISSLPLYEGVD